MKAQNEDHAKGRYRGGFLGGTGGTLAARGMKSTWGAGTAGATRGPDGGGANKDMDEMGRVRIGDLGRGWGRDMDERKGEWQG